MRSDADGLLDGSSEDDLVAGAMRNDEAAIRTIIRLHNRTLFRLARSILPDDGAEDALQDAYIRAFSSVASFRGEASLRTWLSRIVLNEALGRARRSRPTVALEILDNADPAGARGIPLTSSVSDPERTMAQIQIRGILEQAIDDLPPAFRTVLVARLVEEMSVEETSHILGLRPETVKTRLHRARLLLRAAIEQRLGTMLTEAFPFGDERCQRVADRVVERLRLTN